MSRTLTVKSGGSAIRQGWHEVTIKKAEYGTYNDCSQSIVPVTFNSLIN